MEDASVRSFSVWIADWKLFGKNVPYDVAFIIVSGCFSEHDSVENPAERPGMHIKIKSWYYISCEQLKVKQKR